MNKLWMWVIAIVGGVLSGLIMRAQEPPVAYHYAEHVEICGGFYAGQTGTVNQRYTTLMGNDSYTIHLKQGGLAFRVAPADLKRIAPEELPRKK